MPVVSEHLGREASQIVGMYTLQWTGTYPTEKEKENHRLNHALRKGYVREEYLITIILFEGPCLKKETLKKTQLKQKRVFITKISEWFATVTNQLTN